jgi:ABC-type hemin transport system ATPase subunit
MNDEHSYTEQQLICQVRSMFYLVDEPTTILTIQSDEQLLTIRASGQLALDLRTLPHGATICATLHDVQLEGAHLVDFHILTCDL